MQLVQNGIIVTMDRNRRILEEGAIAISQGRIMAVGGAEEMRGRFDYDRILDARGKVLIPGFVNAHTHLFQTPLRGFGDDLPLAEWISRGVYPFAPHMDAEACRHASMLAMTEMIRSGVTTYVDSHYLHQDPYCCDAIVDATLEVGMRGVLSRASMDQSPAPEFLRESIDRAVRECDRVIQAYHGCGGGRIEIRVEPMNEVTASHDLIRAMHEVSRQYGVGMCMHVVETRERLISAQAQDGRSPIETLSELGVLGPNLILAHCIWTTEKDRQLLAETGTGMVHNAVANQYLGDGIAPILDYRKRGIRVALGTDGAAGNNNLDMFAVMKAACLLQKVTALDSSVISANTALEMATIGGAEALGMGDKIGSIEEGKYADLVLIDLDTIQMVPRCNYLSNLVYAASPAVVDTVMIHGDVVFENKAFTRLDEQKVIANANGLVDKLMESVRRG